MRDGSRIAVLAAIEDDNLLLARAEYHWDADQKQYDVPVIGKIQRNARDRPTTQSKLHQQGDFDEERLIEHIVEFGKSISAEAYGISTFGAVVKASGLVRHAPSENDGNLVTIPFKQRILKAHGKADISVYVQNDASAAALGEALAGIGVGVADFAYLWVGRGINIGMVTDGGLYRASLHPEVGHIPIARNPDDPLEHGTCPTHDHCITSLCSYLSVLKRQELDNPPTGDQIRDFVGDYLAELCVQATLFFAPAQIAVGGISVQRDAPLHGILPVIRSRFEEALGIYPRYDQTFDIDSFIVPATLGDEAGLMGMSEVVRRGLTEQVEEDLS